MQLTEIFRPKIPGSTRSTSVPAIKSVTEMMISIKKNLKIDEQDPQLELGQKLSSEVFNDSCNWVRENVKVNENHQLLMHM